jgi:hypothetical protein
MGGVRARRSKNGGYRGGCATPRSQYLQRAVSARAVYHGMLQRVLIMALTTLCLSAATAADPATICSGAKHREFDFWAGRWKVLDAGGNVAGDNVITIEQGGCVLVEQWRSAKGGTGQSYNYYDPAAQSWKQRWVGLGLILEMQGRLEQGAMVLEGPLHYVRQARTTLLRGTWTPLPDGRLRQRFVESVDAGKTWTDWFDGYYSRVP